MEKLEQAGVYRKKAIQIEKLYVDHLESRAKSGDLLAFLALLKRCISGSIQLIKLELIYRKERKKWGFNLHFYFFAKITVLLIGENQNSNLLKGD